MTEKARVPNTDLTFSILHASRAFFITAFFLFRSTQRRCQEAKRTLEKQPCRPANYSVSNSFILYNNVRSEQQASTESNKSAPRNMTPSTTAGHYFAHRKENHARQPCTGIMSVREESITTRTEPLALDHEYRLAAEELIEVRSLFSVSNGCAVGGNFFGETLDAI